MNQARVALEGFLRANEAHLTVVAAEGDSWDVLVPSYWRESIAVSFSLTDRRLRGDAFYLRKPDEQIGAAYALLLRRNDRAHCWKFAVNEVGDVSLVCELPTVAVTPDELDRLFGALITLVDETYVPYMRLAFGTALAEQIAAGGPGLDRPPWARDWEAPEATE